MEYAAFLFFKIPARRCQMPKKPWYKSKTLWVNIVVGSAAVLTYVAGDQFPIPFNEQVLGWIVFGQAVLNAALRLVTSKPIG